MLGEVPVFKLSPVRCYFLFYLSRLSRLFFGFFFLSCSLLRRLFLFSSLPNLIVDFLGIYRDLPSLPQPTSLLLISMAWGVSFLLRLRRQQYAWTVGGRLWPGFQ